MTCTFTRPIKSIVALCTVPVRLASKNGSSAVVNALLDDASMQSYVSGRVASMLHLDGIRRTMIVVKLNGY